MEIINTDNTNSVCKCKRCSKIPGKIVIYEKPTGGPFDDILANICRSHAGGGGGVLISSGTVTWRNSTRYHTVVGSCLLLINPSIAVNLKFSNDFDGYFFWMSEEFLDTLTIDLSKSDLMHSMATGQNIKPLSAKDLNSLTMFMKLISMTVAEGDEGIRDKTLRMLIKAFYYKTLSKDMDMPDVESKRSHKDQLTKDFLLLARKYGHQHRDLEFYADKLCVTPKYLSCAISKTSGKKAHQWLEQATINKSKYLLKETTQPIYLIADELNFTSPADFVRYFRKRVGVTPLGFRRS